MDTVTVYNTDSVRARDILTQVDDGDVLTEVMECTGKVYVEQCFFNARQRFDGGLGGLELKIIGTVKELFIEDYEDRRFPCSTKKLDFIDAEPVIINMQLTAKEKGHLYECGVDHPGFEPPANMKYNVMEIPMLIEYKGIYESPVCFARIIRPNEIQTSTKKCGYYGLFDLVAKHPDVVLEEENGGIDINLTKTSPEVRMAAPAKTVIRQDARKMDKSLDHAGKEQESEPKSVSVMRDIIREHVEEEPDRGAKSDAALKIYKEAVEEFEDKMDVRGETNVSDIETDGTAPVSETVVPYTVRQMNSALYDILSQKVDEHAGDPDGSAEEQEKDAEDMAGTDMPVTTADLSDEDKTLTKGERDAKRQINLARRADIAADNKALNEDANADIAGQGASSRKTSAQELLGDIMKDDSRSSSGQQFL